MNVAATPTQPAIRASENFARNLFFRGTDCLGATEVKQVFGIEVEAPPIPFTEEELVRARALGQFLVLFADKNATGAPLTMKGVCDHLGNKLADDGRLLYVLTNWYKEEVFFATNPIAPVLTWKFVSRKVIPDSTKENYLGQTQAIVDYLVNQVYEGEELPMLYQEAVEEFDANESRLDWLMDNDEQKATEELVALKVNQLFRLSPGELVYSIALYQGVNRERLLENVNSWTTSRDADGDLVYVGNADSDGAGVECYGPGYLNDDLGVLFSRSGLAES